MNETGRLRELLRRWVAEREAGRPVVPEQLVNGSTQSPGAVRPGASPSMITEGFGEKFPIASNETPDGRQANRRVELRLVPLTKG